jgi:hypothetical protein
MREPASGEGDGRLDTIINVLGWAWRVALCVDLLLLPLALGNRDRGWVAAVLFVSSSGLGISLWCMSAIAAFAYWGVFGLLIVLFAMSVGMSILATFLMAGHRQLAEAIVVPASAYRLTGRGERWLIDNQEQLDFKVQPD